jgi:hypothetical protein
VDTKLKEIMLVAAIVLSSSVLVLLPILVPFVTGMVAHIQASSKVKAGIMLALSGLVTLIQEGSLADGTAVHLEASSLTQWALNIVIATGLYTGLMKPFGVAAKLWPNFGVGGPTR